MKNRVLFSTIVVLALVASACGGGGTAKEVTDDDTPSTAPETSADKTTDKTRPDAKGGQPYDEILALALTDIQAYWTETLPDVYGIDYTEIPEADLIAATPDNPPPACGEELSYADVEGNAFYCFPGEYVAWDNEEFFPELYNEFGTFTVALVLAHEWGHVIQGQAQIDGPSVLTELQADCFAGSWTGYVADGDSPNLELDASAFQQSLGGLLKLRDEPGTSAEAEQAHGSGFDRVNAFQEGYTGGAERCADYADNPPIVLEIPFLDEAEAETGGNLPVDQLVEAAAIDLNDYWVSLDADFIPVDSIVGYNVTDAELPTCGGEAYTAEELEYQVFFCAADNYVAYDIDLAESVTDEIGDFGLATLLSFQWTVSAQTQAGITEETVDTSLQRACFTGSWAGSILNGRTDQFGLSPGDLDEAVQAFISFGDTPGEDEAVGSAFDLVGALREGVFEGEDTCAAYTGGT